MLLDGVKKFSPRPTGCKILAAVVEQRFDDTHAGQIVDECFGGALLVAQVVFRKPPRFTTRLASTQVALPAQYGLWDRRGSGC